ncbi:MAG: DUF4140 domain-containing protein [Chloroflexi bacterium]|nr:DUF4140 domain-containing protein [Chloroflexota bacterium]
METTIAAVTVFNNRARVTRQGRAQLEPGTHTLSISELPLRLIHDSVRVSGEGAGVTLLGVDVRKEEYTDVPEADIAQLRREHDDLVYSIKALEDEATALDARMTWLRSLAEFSGEQYARWLARGRAVLDEATNLGDYIVEQTGLINERLRAIEREKRDLEKAREALERRLQRVERPRTHTRNVIDIQLEAQQAA